MQSINAGFQSLKTLLPHHAGEKLSKAAILQQTSEYISSLERDKTTVMAENDRLRQQLMNINNTLNSINAAVAEESPPPKRKKRDTESSDEGIGLCEESTQLDEMRKKLLDIQLHFDQEKRMRLKFEDRSRALEAKLQKLSSHVLDKEAVMSLNEVDEKPSQPLFNSSMSRRNLETIVEAIRHLEGDRIGLAIEEQQHPNNNNNMSQFDEVECINAPPAHQHGNAVYNSSGGRGVVSITEQQQRQKKVCSGTGETVAPCSVIGSGKESCVKMGGSGGVVLLEVMKTRKTVTLKMTVAQLHCRHQSTMRRTAAMTLKKMMMTVMTSLTTTKTTMSSTTMLPMMMVMIVMMIV
ncbi:transcription factor AP-4 isoform X2 [Octopus sinensis]|nr:transcription factor AP-4 isoform X2 [Octopus sinensis]